MTDENEVEKTENWYGEEITLEQALEVTAALRDLEVKSQWFTGKKGQVLQAKQHVHDMAAGGLAIVLVDSPNHTMFLHPEEERRQMGYSSNYKDFKPASEERVRLFFGEEAKIEDEDETNPADVVDDDSNDTEGQEAEDKNNSDDGDNEEVATESPAEEVNETSENADDTVEENTTESADNEDLPETPAEDTKSE